MRISYEDKLKLAKAFGAMKLTHEEKFILAKEYAVLMLQKELLDTNDRHQEDIFLQEFSNLYDSLNEYEEIAANKRSSQISTEDVGYIRHDIDPIKVNM